MRLFPVHFFFALLLSVMVWGGSAAVAADAPQAAAQDKKVTAAQPEQEELHTVLLTTLQYAVADFWHRSPPQFPPSINVASTVYHDQKLVVLPMVGKYTIGPEGEIDVSCSMEIVYPGGKVQPLVSDMTLFKDKRLAVLGPLFPDQLLFLGAEAEDPEGTYTLRLTVTDNISKQTMTTEKTFLLASYTVPALPEDFNADVWFRDYYRHPQPQLALPALYAILGKIPADRLDNVLPPVLGFYNNLLAENTWLLPFFSTRLEQALDTANNGGQITSADIALGLLLSYHMRSMDEKPAGISDRIWLETEPNRCHDWRMSDPLAGEHITLPGQLDSLWGEFLATGSYAPVRRLVSATVQREISVAELPASMAHLTPEQLQILSKAVADAAVWSITSNAKQHRLVHAYLSGMIFFKADLTAAERENVIKILADVQQEMEQRKAALEKQAAQEKQSEQKK